MNTPVHDGVWDVLVDLYDQLQMLPPGREDAEATEHALWLAVSPRRSTSEPRYLRHEVLLNARFSVRRGAARRGIALGRAQGAARNGCITGCSPHPETATPEEIVFASDLLVRIRTAVAELGSDFTRCLQGLLSGESETETAEALGVSARTVRRHRKAIRSVVARIAPEECKHLVAA